LCSKEISKILQRIEKKRKQKKNQYQNFEDVPSQDRNFLMLALPVKKKSEQKFLNQKLEEEA